MSNKQELIMVGEDGVTTMFDPPKDYLENQKESPSQYRETGIHH